MPTSACSAWEPRCRRRRRDRGIEHLPSGAVARWGLGSGAAGCYPDATVEGCTRSRPARRRPARFSTGIAAISPAGEKPRPSGGESTSTRCSTSRPPVPAGAEGLIVRDDWQGNRSPYKNPQARGAIVGLSLAHGPGHVFALSTKPPPAAPATSLKTPPRMALQSSASSSAAAAPLGPLAADSRRHLEEPVHLTRESESCALGSAMAAALAGVLIAISTRPPATGRHREDRRAKPGQRRSLR